MDIVDAVLRAESLQPKRSDISNLFPEICAHEEDNPHDFVINAAVFPAFEQPSDEHRIFLTRCRRAGSTPEIPPQEENSEIPFSRTLKNYIEWLETTGCSIMRTMYTGSLRVSGNLKQGAIILLQLAEDLEYLLPRDNSHLGHHSITMSKWKMYWNALIAEMKTVEKHCLPEICNSGVYVLTTWPYNEFLRLLAGDLLDKAIAHGQE